MKIAQKIGEKDYKNFLSQSNLLKKSKLEIEEIGIPLNFKCEKCKLETISFGHGITTTLIQLAKGYAIISNGGYDITPTLIKDKNISYAKKKRVLSKDVSLKINKIL